MRPKSITVTSANSPYYYPTNWRGGKMGLTATPTGAGNYDVAYTNEPIGNGAANVTDWVDVTDMSAATAQASKAIDPVTCIRVTLNSGTSVKIDISQSDV